MKTRRTRPSAAGHQTHVSDLRLAQLPSWSGLVVLALVLMMGATALGVGGRCLAEATQPKKPEGRQLIVDPQPKAAPPPVVGQAPTAGAAAQPAPKPAAPAPAPQPEIRLDAQGEPLVSNSFANTDIRDALGQIAQQTGTVIVPDTSVTGTVTLELADVPLRKALQLALMQGGYIYLAVEKGMYLVTSADPAAPNFRRIAKTEIVRLDYIECDDVKAMLPTYYSKFVRYETGGAQETGEGEQTNPGVLATGTANGASADRLGAARASGARVGTKVVVSAPPELLEEIVMQIRLLDQPPQQIMVEALVVEALASDLSEFEAKGQSRFLNSDSGTGLVNYTSVAQNLLASVQWLVTRQRAELKANPSIVAQEGRCARVEVAQEQYFSILSGSVAYPYTTIQQIDAAISLEIMPRIAEKTGEITMRLRPAVADVTGTGANALPIITKRSADTTVRVKDGQVIAIGGLLESVKTVTRSKIPILGDIPLIGQLFRSSDTSRQTREVIIFIVPHKLGPDGSMTGKRLLDLTAEGGKVTLPATEARAAGLPERR